MDIVVPNGGAAAPGHPLEGIIALPTTEAVDESARAGATALITRGNGDGVATSTIIQGS